MYRHRACYRSIYCATSDAASLGGFGKRQAPKACKTDKVTCYNQIGLSRTRPLQGHKWHAAFAGKLRREGVVAESLYGGLLLYPLP